MTLKQLATAAFYLPATAFSAITNLLLGSTSYDKYGNEVRSRGLFGLIIDTATYISNVLLGAAKYIARGVANFIANHKQAIAIAFWSSLVLAGAATLTVALWPAALAAVTGFSIAGWSIAGVVGAGYWAQVGAVAALGTIATSVVVYTAAAIVNTITGIRDFFVNRKKAGSDAVEEVVAEQQTATAFYTPTPSPLAGLSTSRVSSRTKVPSSSSDEEIAPVQTAPLFPAAVATPVAKTDSIQKEEEIVATTTALCK